MATPSRTRKLACAAVSSALVASAAQAQGVSFEEARNFAAGSRPSAVAVGDFNGDQVQDLLVVNEGREFPFNPGNVSVLLGNGDGSFQEALTLEAGNRPQSAAVGDFNGDGVADLAVANEGLFPDLGQVSVLLGNGDGTFLGGELHGGTSSSWHRGGRSQWRSIG